MIFTDNKRCPVCGAMGKSVNEKDKIRNCPVCGTVFSEFGVILSTEVEENLPQNN